MALSNDEESQGMCFCAGSHFWGIQISIIPQTSQCLIPKCLIVSVRHHENQVRVMTFEAY